MILTCERDNENVEKKRSPAVHDSTPLMPVGCSHLTGLCRGAEQHREYRGSATARAVSQLKTGAGGLDTATADAGATAVCLRGISRAPSDGATAFSVTWLLIHSPRRVPG